MLKCMDKRGVLRNILVYMMVAVISFSFSRISLYSNRFVFIIPFVMFCFFNNKYVGYLSSLISFFVLGNYNSLFYLLFFVFFVGVCLLKKILKNNKSKLEQLSSFYCFFVVLISGVVVNVIYNYHDYLLCFLLAVVSYWLMRYFFKLYISMHLNEKRYLTSILSVFILFILGVSFIGLNLEYRIINFSLIGIVLLSFIAGEIGEDTGALYSFLITFLLYVLNGFNAELVLFFCTSIISFLLRKTSKVTLAFTYLLIVFFYLNNSVLNLFIGVNYVLGVFLFCFIPSKFIESFSAFCYGSEKYMDKLSDNYKTCNLEISNQIIKMEEIFSLVVSKLNVRGRIKKSEKELLIDEVCLLNDLMNKFANKVKMGYITGSENVENELYKYGFDVLYFNLSTDVFNNKLISLNIRCDKKEIGSIVVPLISKVMKKRFKVRNFKYNDIFDFYELALVEVKDINFNIGVSQSSKEEVCGDSYLFYETENKKVFALSDGMGVGKEAKSNSKVALELLRKFMDVGFDEEHSINSINCVLKNDYCRESYATLDLFVYDKYNKEFSFFKNGSCNSYVLNKDGVKSVDGDDLPIGIMDSIKTKKNRVDLNKGDYVVMVSDGVNEKVFNVLSKFKNNNPQKIAEEILNFSNPKTDDETVIVIKIK